MSDKHPLRTGILSAVLGGLILAALLGQIPLPWRWARLASEGFRGFMLGTFSMPRWGAILLAVLFALLLFGALRRALEAIGKELSTFDPNNVTLDAVQTNLLRHLGRERTMFLTLEDLRMRLGGMTSPELWKTVESLEQEQLVSRAQTPLGIEGLHLTSRGRDVVLARKLG